MSNEHISNLLSAIVNDKPTDVKAAFDSAIQDKIEDITDTMLKTQAATMFEPENVTPDTQSNPEFDDTVFDNLSDEELEALNNLSDEEWDDLLNDIESNEPEETNG